MFDHPDFDEHERVIHAHDRASGLCAVVAIHSTVLGPAFGGCRMWPYRDAAGALTDALRLSRGMTYKAAICNLPYGGGKAVIIGDPRTGKSPALLAAVGRLVESLGGAYIIADDVGTTLADMAEIRRYTAHTAAATATAREPLPVTAHGVCNAIKAVAKHVLGPAGVSGRIVAVQGLGNVGMPLCALLHDLGASLVVADIDRTRAERAASQFGARVVGVDDIYDQPMDLFAPCALGAVLDDRTIPRLKARAICGGANNQLASARHDAALAARGILYLPDFLAGAGGVIDFHQEAIDDRPDAVLRAVQAIGTIAAEVVAVASTAGVTPLAVAERIVRRRLGRG